ncbi:MAG: CusA/CzcA family heavy metal efflux RND transporter [Gammaproteobacteria bacterium]|nr:CusA/CzcA family heavy metal efflux RND transporter [Gammaproteobacteria bacterium]MDH5730152.1 CusA/CzcA family heavy metal efflux RND transporter [Gammaproteobacteria bacterium]
MIAGIIRWSVFNRPLVLIFTTLLAVWGVYSVKNTPLDAIPDLSDLQVIIKTSFPGQSPEVVEDQVTYPITTAMLSVPGTTAVRGYSFFGDSYVYVIFEEDRDIYWARSRVLEYLSQVSGQLPPSAKPELGPDATGVGWVYEYALVDRSGKYDLAQLRSYQDWFLKFGLQTVPGVSEVATIGGMVKQYQVVVDPDRLRAYRIPLNKVKMAIQRANQEVGGSVIEMAEAEYMIRAKGYIQNLDDLRLIPLGVNKSGTPILMRDVAEVRLGPQMRRGIAELNGEGEVVGGVVVMRWGENALTTIDAVKEKMETLKKGLPEGIEVIETYDRSALIKRSVETLATKLLEEFLVVAVVCAIFLFHLRSAFVAIVILPLGILVSYIVMYYQGINSNIMSLGGIAIAIGAMVDAAIVMIENAHKHIEKGNITAKNRWEGMCKAAEEVGPALFFSLLIITLSFLPVFTLEAQEGKLFSPLAYTKTYAMAASAGLSITLLPVLMGYFIRGNIRPEHQNPVNRLLVTLYLPVIKKVLQHPKATVLVAIVFVLSTYIPLANLGSEFMPELDEGDLMYMPTTFTGVSIGKAGELLQITDRLIKTVPEVRTVFGKVGRAETATDPAPLTMIETTIQLKPRSEWREGMTTDKLKKELDAIVKLPGLTNAWVMPIKTRIDMISTGIKTPLGIKILGPDLNVIQEIGQNLESIVKQIPGTASVYSERVAGGRYINVDIRRKVAARYGLNIADIHEVVGRAVGGRNIAQTVEGLERYPINIRYPRHVRDSIEKLLGLPIITPSGRDVNLGEVADITIVDGPGMIKSEDARRTGWVFVDIRDRDLGSYVAEAQKVVLEKLELPPGYELGWSGQYEYMLRAKERLYYVVPLTIVIIVLLLYFHFRNFTESFMVMGAVPLALVGALWIIYAMGYNFSVAVGVGIIALAGVSAEFGVIMLVYLKQAMNELKPTDMKSLHRAIIYGAVMRVRPIAMTAAVILAGLLPILLGGGTGSEVMRRIAAPMLGGMITAPAVSMILIPALFALWKGREFAINYKSDDEGPQKTKPAKNDSSLANRLTGKFGKKKPKWDDLQKD